MYGTQVMRAKLSVPPSGLTFILAFIVLQALLIDGYISQTFKSCSAEEYFLNLLKSSSIPPHTTLSYTSRGDYFFFVHSVPPHIPAPFPEPPGRWLLDRGIIDGGTMVRQTMVPAYCFQKTTAHRNGEVADARIFRTQRQGTRFFSWGIYWRATQRSATCEWPCPVGSKDDHTYQDYCEYGLWLVCSLSLNLDSFTNNISGLVIRSSSAKSRFVTSLVSATLSPWPSSLVRLGEPLMLSSGSVFERPSSLPCNKPYFLGLRIRLRVRR